MDFLERFLRVAPDGGNGALELLLFLIPIAGILLIRAWGARRQRA
jgi:hypothetical protein